MTAKSNAERQAIYRLKMDSEGFVKVSAWAPKEVQEELKSIMVSLGCRQA